MVVLYHKQGSALVSVRWQKRRDGWGGRHMDDIQKYLEGFQRGWESVVGPALQPPDIEIAPPNQNGSRFMQGLVKGIEAGKKKIDELN